MRLAVIGTGNMATAILGGVLRAGLYRSEDIIASDVDAAKREKAAAAFGIRVTGDNADAASQAPTLLLAVKPQNLETVGADLKGRIGEGTLVVSILAGSSIAKIRANLGESLPVVRVMPNLPALVGCGMAGMAGAPEVSDEQRDEARRILETVGKVVELPEDLIDAVTALSGSGPGFVFRLMESFAKAGESIGLSPEAAELLTRQTFLGAARLIDETGEKAGDLRAKVSSPGGTTLAGLGVMEEKGIEDLVRATLEAARDRARELGG